MAGRAEGRGWVEVACHFLLLAVGGAQLTSAVRSGAAGGPGQAGAGQERGSQQLAMWPTLGHGV